MQVVSDAWERGLRFGLGVPIFKLEVFDSDGARLASTSGAVDPYPALLLDDGGVTIDASSSTLRRATVRLVASDASIIPSSPLSLLSSTSGNEIKLWRGLRYQNGTEELKPLGVFGIASEDTDDDGLGVFVTIEGFDRSRRIRRSRFTETYKVESGTNYVTAITSVLFSRWMGVETVATPTNHTTPQIVFDPRDDPWEKAKEMAEKIGYDLFFDPDGVCILEPREIYTVDSPTTFEYHEGEDATILAVARRSSNEDTFNGVIFTGASSSNTTPPRGEAWDIDPASPTYSGFDPGTGTFGDTPYGAVPFFESSSLLKTSTQCQEAAEAKLDELRGRSTGVEFVAFTNPAHDHRDLISIRRDRVSLTARFELDQFTIPLSVDGMMTARTKETIIS